MNSKLADNILFEAAYWASIKETKKKIRPKDIESLPKNKNTDFYTKLQKEVILSLLKEYKENDLILEIELNKYLVIFYELSCIKRDRRNKNDI